MVTTRSQERGLQTPVSSASKKSEIVVPTPTRSTPRTDSSSITRKTRSTPRTSTQKPDEDMGISASKIKPPSEAATEINKDAALAEQPGEISAHRTHPAPELPTTPPHEAINGSNAELPERPKAASPTSPGIPLNKHKRFHSEEPKDSVAISDDPTHPRPLPGDEDLQIPDSESDGAPEVEKITARKSATRSINSRKRRRVEPETVQLTETVTKLNHQDSYPTLEDHEVGKAVGILHSSLDKTLGDGETRTALAVPDQSVDESPLTGGDTEPQTQALDMSNPPRSLKNAKTHDDPGGEKLEAISTTRTDSPAGVNTEASLTELDMTTKSDAIPLVTQSDIPLEEGNPGTIVTASEDAIIPQPIDMTPVSLETGDTEIESHTEAESTTATHNSFATMLDVQSVTETQIPTSTSEVEHMALTDKRSVSASMAAPSKPARSHKVKVRPRQTVFESKPTTTSLQDYRNRLLGRHPRTRNWGPPGFRRTKFVGA